LVECPQFVFSDTKNGAIFTTTDFGSTFTGTKVEFVPEDVIFDPVQPQNLIGLEKTTKDRNVSALTVDGT
jgi:hypothetical protein